MLGVMLIVNIFGVVISYNIQILCALLSRVPAHIVGAYCYRMRVLIIVNTDASCKLLGYLGAARRGVGVVNFVAYAPHYNAGVVAVAPHPAARISFVPLREEAVIVVVVLFKLPHIKAFAVD